MKDLRNYIFIASFLAYQIAYFFYTKNIDYIISAFGLSILISLIITTFLVHKNKQLSDLLSFYIFPILSTISLYSSSTLIDRSMIYPLGVVVISLTSFYFKQVYIYHFKMKEYKIGTLENFSNYAILLIFILFSSSMYGFRTELDTASWKILSGIAIYSCFSIYQLFWANKISIKEMMTTLIVTVITITEIAWAISTLPFDYLSSAILLSIGYYSLTNIAKFNLLELLEPIRLKFYLSFLTICYILIFLSVRWL